MRYNSIAMLEREQVSLYVGERVVAKISLFIVGNQQIIPKSTKKKPI